MWRYWVLLLWHTYSSIFVVALFPNVWPPSFSRFSIFHFWSRLWLRLFPGHSLSFAKCKTWSVTELKWNEMYKQLNNPHLTHFLSTEELQVPSPMNSPGESSTSSRDGSPSRDPMSPSIGPLKPPIIIKRPPRNMKLGFHMKAIRVYLGVSDVFTLHHLVTVNISPYISCSVFLLWLWYMISHDFILKHSWWKSMSRLPRFL